MDSKNTKNSTILFVISTYYQYQTYIQTQVLKEIKDKLVFIVTPELAKMDFGVFSDRIFPYSYSDQKNTFHRHVFYINAWQNRKRHPVFLYRLAFITPRQKRIYRIMSLPILSSIVKYIFLKMAEDKNLFGLIQKINPSIILLPSHAYEGRTFEIIRIAKKIKVPSFMLTDNWDTLATKTIFTIKPDYLGVWSKQQIKHAIEVRGMPKERIFILGVPRFMIYMKPESGHQPSPYPFRYILYVGMSDLFDELGALHKIDEIIDRRKIDLKVIYRPKATQHTRNCPDVFFEYDFKHVILDTPARLYYKQGATWDIKKDSFNPNFFPDFSYFPKLLSNMEFMICSQSTMILEASLFDKKIYLLAYNDGIHYFSPDWNFKNCTHFFGLERLKNVRMVRTIDDMERIFSPGDELKQSVEPIDIDYFVSKETTANYPANLKKTVDTILTNWHYEPE